MKPKTVFTVENIVNVWETHPDASSPIAVLEKNGTTESSAPAKRTSSSRALVINDESALVSWLHEKGFGHCFGYRKPYLIKSEVKKLIKAGLDVPGCFLSGQERKDDDTDK